MWLQLSEAIRTVQIMCRKTVERMIDLLENESQIEKNVRIYGTVKDAARYDKGRERRENTKSLTDGGT